MTNPIQQALAAVEPVVTRDEARLLADRFAEYVFADRQWVTREDLKPGMGVYDALSEFFREALATVEHNARREAEPKWKPLLKPDGLLAVDEGETYLFAIETNDGWEYFSDSIGWDADEERVPCWHGDGGGWSIGPELFFAPLPSPPPGGANDVR